MLMDSKCRNIHNKLSQHLGNPGNSNMVILFLAMIGTSLIGPLGGDVPHVTNKALGLFSFEKC